MEDRKKKLYLGIVLDAVGMGTYFIPGLGPFLDLLWAPVAAWFMTKMYKGQAGKTAGVIAFLEEVLPGTDFIPSFTLMWFYTYKIKKETKVITTDQ